MTDKARLRIEVGIIALLFGAGAGWGAFQLQLSTLAKQVERIDQRVTAMYCSSVAESQRAACR
jgi:hypothetical protein